MPATKSSQTQMRRRATARQDARRTRSFKGLRRRLRNFCRRLPVAEQNRVQFAAEEEEETGEIHPRQQNDERSERQISRVVSVVFGDVKLKEFCDNDPAQGKKHRTRQSLPNRQIIFRREEIKGERQNDQCDGGQGQIQKCDPLLQWHSQLEVYFRNPGERFAKDGQIKGEENRDSKPEEEKK